MKKIKITFLDRDGVINSSRPNNGYVGSLKNFKWVPGAIKAIKYSNDKNYIDMYWHNSIAIEELLKKNGFNHFKKIVNGNNFNIAATK